MNKKIRACISIVALLMIGTLTYTGNFIRDVFVIGFIFAIALGVIDLIDKKIRK